MRRALLLALAAAISAAELPLELTLHVPIARFDVHGRPADLIVDTGAGITVLDADFAQSLQPASAKSATVEGAGRSVSVRNLNPVPIAIPGQPPISVPAVAVSLEALSRQAGRRIHGVLGAHFLRRHVVEFDYQAGLLRFHSPAAFSPAPGSQSLPLQFEDGRPTVEASFSIDGARQLSGRFLLDTGSNHALTLLPPFAARHSLPAPSAPQLDDPGLGIGGPSPAVLTPMHSLRLGAAQLPIAALRLRRSGKGNESGLIGGPVWRHFRFAVDYPGKRLHLAPQATPLQLLHPDLAGLRISWDGDHFQLPRVSEILPGRAAARAGLQPGDLLLAPSLSPSHLFIRLRSPGPFPLTIRRQDRERILSLDLTPLFPARDGL